MKSTIVRHYLQLFRRYRRPALAIVALFTVATAGLSAIRLFSAPTYRAAASVLAVPTEAQLQFAREAASAGRATLAETHIEYLKSRPVMESVLDRISTDVPEAKKRTGVLVKVNSIFQGLKRFARRVYRVLNSGTYVTADRRETELRRLMQGVGVDVVPGSFIFRIVVDHQNPEIAAAAANALADSYIEQTTADLETSVLQLEGFFESELSSRQQALEELRSRELELRAVTGLRSAEGERSYLEDAKEQDRRKLVDAQIGLQSLESSLKVLRIELAGTNRSDIRARLEQQIALGQAELEALKREVDMRQVMMNSTSGKLDTLHERESPLLDLQQEQRRIETELSELRSRILDVTLTRTSALAQLRLISPAVAPSYPSSPRILDDTIIAAVTSLFAVLLFLIAIDTFSGAIKTEVDLERATNTATLGVLGRRQLGGDESSAPTSAHERLAPDIQKRLAMAGAFDSGSIRVTGFLDRDEIKRGASMVAEALERSGTRVSVDGRQAGSQGRKGAPGDDGSVEVTSLPPLGTPSFRWQDATDSFLVCLVPADEVSEETLGDVYAKAQACGTSLSCILVRS